MKRGAREEGAAAWGKWVGWELAGDLGRVRVWRSGAGDGAGVAEETGSAAGEGRGPPAKQICDATAKHAAQMSAGKLTRGEFFMVKTKTQSPHINMERSMAV